jgi:two-component system sensor histidine kinase SenX3
MSSSSNRPDMNLFLASSIHDMKNSIGILGGTLEGMLNHPSDFNAETKSQMAFMLFETKRLNNQLIQLLALYKAGERNAYPFEPHKISLSVFAQEVQASQIVLMTAEQILFEIDISPELNWYFDEDLVFGVVCTAINNAIRYTRDKIVLRAAVVDDFLEIRIEDNGFGFPASILEHGDAVSQGVSFTHGNTGLGLYFAHEVARLHQHRGNQGSVVLENTGLEGGASFILRLP